MDWGLLLRNRSVSRVVVGVPEGHVHVRARIETESGDVITLQEATLAALCRAFMDVTTHPSRHAVELRSAPVAGRKDGFAPHQLLEVPTDEVALRAELAAAPPPPMDAAPGYGPDGTASGDPFAGTPGPVAEPGEVTAPHKARGPVTTSVLKTDHGQPDDVDDVELEAVDEADDGPVFGNVPTLHSKPDGTKATRPKRKRKRKK